LTQWQRSSVANTPRAVCQVPDTSHKKEKNFELCHLVDRTDAPKLEGCLTGAKLAPLVGPQLSQGVAEMKKLRTFVAGLLLVPVLALAGPLGNDAGESGLNPTTQVTGYCYIYWMGRWILVPCT
jgi:hypothetical protein